jgi:HD-like signal output (HDOD) protein
MHLDDLLDSETALPSVPKVIAQVLSELHKEEPDLRAISALINTDIGLTTRLLCVANSAQFNLAKKLGTVSEALAVLGLDQVTSLTTAAAVAGAFKTVPGMEMQAFWRYSLDVAKLSRKLANLVHSNLSLAFTAGLVHAAGELVMHLGMPDQMRWLNERVEPLALKRIAAEVHLLGYSYAEAGAGFCEQWAFPATLVDAIRHQNAPLENDTYEPLAGVLHLASWRVRAREAGLNDAQLAVTYPDDVALALRLDVDEVLQQAPIDWTTPQEARALA